MQLNSKSNYKKQLITSISLVMLVAIASFLGKSLIGYRVVAYILLVTVSLLAMIFDILPVLIAALLSAMIWNFFFIPPIFTFHIEATEDFFMFLMYFIIALVNAVLTFKIREQEKKARDKEKKENTIKLYNTLLNSLSHELRTPIATIIGAIDTLTENRKKLSEQHQDQLLQEMNKASLRLNRQVDNLLNMSRLETGELHLKYDWCDINELIYTLIHKLPEDALHHIIDFSPQENLPLLKLDIGLMEHVLLNIIHNALHYTPENSIISIKTGLEDETLEIIIQDNGVGFPENEIQYAFDKFYRLPQTKGGGTGLGLSIAKGFVLAHQGTIHLKNRTEGGACFTIKIPVETTYLNNLKNE